MSHDEKSGTALEYLFNSIIFLIEKYFALTISPKTKNSTVLTVHLKDVSLADVFVAVCVACVVAHVSRGNLSNIQRPIISKILYGKSKI